MDDLISRKAMREAMYHEAIEKASNEQRWDGGCWIRYKMFERVIESLPSAQKTGKWINCKYPLGECSECHAIVDIQNNEANYCPVCGSRNRGDTDDEI